MTNSPDYNNLTIVGGGITGLVAAYMAAKSGLRVRVLEASNEFGGLIKTFQVGNTELECFYHHFFLHDQELLWLIKELGLENRIISRKTSMGIYAQNKLYSFSNLMDLVRFSPINLFGKLRFLICTIYLGKFCNWRKNESIPAIKWFYKWSGKQVTINIWEPLLKVKFGRFSKVIPLAWMVGRLRQRFKSRENGDEKLLYIEGSHSVLLKALIDRLKSLNVELITNSRVDQLILEHNILRGVHSGSRTYYSEKVLFTIPSHYIHRIIKKQKADVKINGHQIQYFGAICYVLELSKSLSPYYWLNIADEDSPFGGIIEHTQFISSKNYEDKHLVYLSRYFSMDEDIASMDKVTVEKLMLKKLSQIFPDFRHEQILKSHFFKSNTAATVCDLNFSEKVPSVKTDIKNLFICNMAHIYPDERSVNNSIRVAHKSCKSMGIKVKEIPNGLSLAGSVGF